MKYLTKLDITQHQKRSLIYCEQIKKNFD